jgi:hypothetical protein
MRKYFNILLVVGLFLFSNCFEPDGAVPFVQSQEYLIDIHDYRESQGLFNLDKFELSYLKNRKKWHLQFSNEPDKWMVTTNPNLKIKVAKTMEKTLEEYTLDDIGILENWEMDGMHNGFVTSAIGKWGDFTFENPKSYQFIYIFSVEEGNFVHYYKLQFLETEDQQYVIKVGDFSPDGVHQLKISKRQNNALIQLNFNQPKEIIYTDLDTYHLRFSVAVDSFWNRDKISLHTFRPQVGLFPTLFINQMEVAIMKEVDFDSINYSRVKNLKYEPLSCIQSFPQSVSHRIFKYPPGLVYVLKNQNGFYKVRINSFQYFLDYYIRWNVSVKRL